MEEKHDRDTIGRVKDATEASDESLNLPKEQERGHRDNHVWGQKLDRYIGFLPSLAFAANLGASWESVAVSFQAGLLNGGPTSLIYGTVLSWVGSMAMAASLAEMASQNPTVGAQYRWTALYAPRGFLSPTFWGLLQGWVTVAAWIATVAQPAFLLGTNVQGLMILNDETYEPKRYQGTLLAWAFLAIPVVCNIFARKALAPIEYVGAFTHTGFLLVWIIALLALKSGNYNSGEFVFTQTITGLSGWTNTGIQWNIGLLSAVFPLSGFDGIIHMSDEVINAPRKVPQSMVLSVFINGFMALIFMIVILFCLGDVETALTTPTGYPIIQVWYEATGSKAWAIVLLIMPIYNGVVAMFSALASLTRLNWAFARDHGLPFPEFFGKVHPTLRIPLNSLMFVSFIIALLQLINIGSTTAFFAIISLSTIALYLSYVLPILFFTIAKIQGDPRVKYGPWKLGRWGLPINIFAILYGIFILIWLPFPPYMPVTAVNMNYGGPVMGAVLLWALFDYALWGRKRFIPATAKVEEQQEGYE